MSGSFFLFTEVTNQKMNAYLKEIADLARIEKHLTTHLARHTFATLSLSNHVSIESISKMLGHSDNFLSRSSSYNALRVLWRKSTRSISASNTSRST